MIKAILLTLMTAITAVSGLFSITTKAEEQVENKEIIKEIYYEDDFNILFKSMNDELYQIKNYDFNNSSPDLIKYDVSKNYEVLFSKNNFLLIKDNLKTLLFYDGKLIKDVTDDVKDKNILFVDKTSIYYENENKLIQFNFNTKEEKQLADNFEKLLYFRYSNDKIFELTYLSKELNGQYHFKKFNNENSSILDNKPLFEITSKYKIVEDKLFVLKDNKLICYDAEDGDLVFEDYENTEFKTNFYYSNNYYKNGNKVYFYDDTLSIASEPNQIFKHVNYSLISLFLNENNTTYFMIRNKSESFKVLAYNIDGKAKIISLTDKEILYEKANKYYRLPLVTELDKVTEFETPSEIPELNNFKVIKYIKYNDYIYSILIKENKLYLRKQINSTLEEKTFDIINLSKKNVLEQITDILDNTKDDIKDKGNKFYKYFKENYLYFIFGFIGIFAVVFLATKAATRRKRRR